MRTIRRRTNVRSCTPVLKLYSSSISRGRQGLRDFSRFRLADHGRSSQMATLFFRQAERQMTRPAVPMLRLAVGRHAKSLFDSFMRFLLRHDKTLSYSNDRRDLWSKTIDPETVFSLTCPSKNPGLGAASAYREGELGKLRIRTRQWASRAKLIRRAINRSSQ